MKTYDTKKLNGTTKTTLHDIISRRQDANYERFMQEKADVFQVTDAKEQAMFWIFS